MNPEKIKERLNRIWDEDARFHAEARAFDVPWSVPYEFSACADDIMWELYGQSELFWAEEDCS